jgi:hypothetical protein
MASSGHLGDFEDAVILQAVGEIDIGLLSV